MEVYRLSCLWQAPKLVLSATAPHGMARETPSSPDQEGSGHSWRGLFHNGKWNERHPNVDLLHENELTGDTILNFLRKGKGAPIAISYGYVPCTRDTLLNSKDACLLAAIAISCANRVLCVELDYSGQTDHTVLRNCLFNEENVLIGIDLNRLVLGLYHCYGIEARVVDLFSLAFMTQDEDIEPSLGVLFHRYPELVEDVVVRLFDDLAFDSQIQTIQNLVERAWVVQALYRNTDALHSDLEGLPTTELGYLMHEVSLFLLPCLREFLKKAKERLTLAQLVLNVDRLRAQLPLFTEHRVEGYIDGTTIRLQSQEFNSRIRLGRHGATKVRYCGGPSAYFNIRSRR